MSVVRVALFGGDRASPELIATSEDPALTALVARRLLRQSSGGRDPLLAPLQRGRRETLEGIARHQAPRLSVLSG